MKVKDLIMELIYCDPEAEVTCVTYKNANEDADEFALNIRVLEDYEDNVDLVLDNLGISKNDYNGTFDNLRNKVLDWGEKQRSPTLRKLRKAVFKIHGRSPRI